MSDTTIVDTGLGDADDDFDELVEFDESDLPDGRYTDRELSWLAFNQRVLELAELGLPIFLDLKLHDIPNTVAKSIQALSPITPAVLTVHAAGGRAMLEDAKAAAPAGTRVVGVTVLTSLDGRDLESIGFNGNSHHQVERYAFDLNFLPML